MKTLFVRAALVVWMTIIGQARAAEPAAIMLAKESNRIVVKVGDRPFTDYYFAADDTGPYVRPYFYPVRAADGTEVTSDQTRLRKTAPKSDHPHHRSLWVAQGDMNGVDHWGTIGADAPKQQHLGFSRFGNDSFVEELAWEGKDQKPALRETRTVKFSVLEDGSRAIDLTSTYTPAAGEVTFGDTKEAGLCAVRVAKPISDAPTLTNAKGQTGEKNTWGKPADWCDISGQIGGKPYGVAVLDHPANPRHPSTWHVREYGLLAANIFGLHEFDKSRPAGAGKLTIKPGESVTFRYRVIIHQGDAKAVNLDAKYQDFAKAAK